VLGSALEHDGFGVMREGLTDTVAEFLIFWTPLSGALPLDAAVFLFLKVVVISVCVNDFGSMLGWL